MKLFKLVFILVFTSLILASCNSKKHVAKTHVSKHKATNKKEYYSKKFGVTLDRESNLKLYAAIDNWIGVKYKFGSCTKSGIDCSCLVNALFREAYTCNTPRDTKGLYEQIKKIDIDDLKEGDLVFFKMEGNKIDHVGVYLSDNKFVHASTKGGVMISSLEEEHFRKNFKTGGRLKCI